MPSRKIPKQTRRVVGQVSALKHSGRANYESSLERDLIEILEFDNSVLSFVTQPEAIHYKVGNRDCRYTPDALIEWRLGGNKTEYWLCEVKYRDDLKKNWFQWKPKFKAATKYCRQKGMRFKILTELDIRTSLLDNILFLKRYRTIDISDYRIRELLVMLEELRETTLETLVTAVAQYDEQQRAEMTWLVWGLIATGHIGVDIISPLTIYSPIWREKEKVMI